MLGLLTAYMLTKNYCYFKSVQFAIDVYGAFFDGEKLSEIVYNIMVL